VHGVIQVEGGKREREGWRSGLLLLLVSSFKHKAQYRTGGPAMGIT